MFDKYFANKYFITDEMFNEKLYFEMEAAIRELRLTKYVPKVKFDSDMIA